MGRDDALLALERHATSKLSRFEELDSIGSLGFRGEALSSIASVARLVLQTSTGDGDGTEILVRGGTIESVRDLGLPRGTTIQVERLFFNTPARRKFLRADATELSHVARLITRFALARPAVRFDLQHGERRLLHCDPAADLAARISQIHGSSFAGKLLPIDHAAGSTGIRGFIGRPAEALPRRDGQHIFVNGRSVQDRVLGHAVAEATANTMPRGRFPALYLFVEVPPDRVDVNVHPQKTEIRFRQSGEVHDAVRDAVASALSGAGAVPSLADLRPGSVAKPGSAYGASFDDLDPQVDRSTVPSSVAEPRAGIPDAWRGSGTYSTPAGEVAPDLVAQSERGEVARRAVPLGQLRESYIVAQDEDGLMLVDQHAAHERVLFERYLEDADRNQVEVQKLLFPVTAELTPEELVLIESEAEEFRRLGLLVDPFGGRSVRIDGVPAVAAEVDPVSFLRELLGEAAQARSATSRVAGLRHRLVTSAACQAAIKIHHPLTGGTMQALLDDLFQTENPGTCPHGRPAVFRLTLDEIERAFRRR